MLTLLICAFIPSVVFASTAQYSVRFTASYVSGNTGGKNVYYIVDGGAAQLLGTVSQAGSMDSTFNATFSDTIRVYVQIGDDAVYNEHLYINNNLVSNGNVGNAGLTYVRNDSIPPSGKITSPISGKIITQCPMMIAANVTDDNSGVDWVIYFVKYDGIWHQIGTDNSSSNTGGYSTQWDCSQVSDQSVGIRISARDNAGNQADILGGDVTITLARGQTNPTPLSSSPTQAPVVITATMAPTETMVQATSTIAVTLSPTPVQLTQTNTVAPSPTPVQKSTPNNPFGITLCSSIFLPLLIGFIFLLWRNRS
jgi:hypothetical protein